jgi:hypothetical protein
MAEYIHLLEGACHFGSGHIEVRSGSHDALHMKVNQQGVMEVQAWK